MNEILHTETDAKAALYAARAAQAIAAHSGDKIAGVVAPVQAVGWRAAALSAAPPPPPLPRVDPRPSADLVDRVQTLLASCVDDNAKIYFQLIPEALPPIPHRHNGALLQWHEPLCGEMGGGASVNPFAGLVKPPTRV